MPWATRRSCTRRSEADDEQRIVASVAAREVQDPLLEAKRGVGALVKRDHETATALFVRADASGASLPLLGEYRKLAIELAALSKGGTPPR
jgi:hypothetical protein